MKGLNRMVAGPRTRRVIRNWLMMRTLQVKMAPPRGTYYGNIHGTTRGLPQGGNVSPPLWLILFKRVAGRLRDERTKTASSAAEYGDSIHADDITLLFSAPALEALCCEGAKNAESLRQILKGLSLEVNDANPLPLAGGIHRKSAASRRGYPSGSTGDPMPEYKKKNRADRRIVAAILREALDCDPHAPLLGEENNSGEGFPYQTTAAIRILGVTIDMFCAAVGHFKEKVAKAQRRQGELSKVARTRRGLEVGPLKMARDAVINSLLRHALVVAGSCFPPNQLSRINKS